jgi:hypothetical protein
MESCSAPSDLVKMFSGQPKQYPAGLLDRLSLPGRAGLGRLF